MKCRKREKTIEPDSTKQIRQSLRRRRGKVKPNRDGGARRALETRTGVESLIQGEIDSTETHRKRASGRDKRGGRGGRKAHRSARWQSARRKKCNAHVKRGKFFREPVHPEEVLVWKWRLMYAHFSIPKCRSDWSCFHSFKVSFAFKFTRH